MKTASKHAPIGIAAARDDSVLVAVLQANLGREPKRVRLKIGRMSADPFAFFRGSCHLFASAWPELCPPDEGPSILACGDLHVENFGAYRDDEGEYFYDINDFDEAAFASCAIDPTRCATSILLAAESWKLTPLDANGLVLAYLDRYRSAVGSPTASRLVEAAAPRIERGPIWDLLGKTAMSTQSAFLDCAHTEQLKDGTRGGSRASKRRYPHVDSARRDLIFEAVEAFGKARGQQGFYRALDVSGRICGVGSLGVERYLVLVAGGGSSETNQLFDIKECLSSAWMNATPEPVDSAREARRVVDAERSLQSRPTAGLDVIPMGEKTYRIREMIPEENRSNLDRFRKKARKLRSAIETAGLLTGLSHVRGAKTVAGNDPTEGLMSWARGAALDSVLVSAARYAEKTRRDFQQFLQELRAPEALPEELRGILRG